MITDGHVTTDPFISSSSKRFDHFCARRRRDAKKEKRTAEYLKHLSNEVPWVVQIEYTTISDEPCADME